MSTASSPIHSLLAAEQQAQEIVSKARNARQIKLKEAKEEADKEVAVYRGKKDEEFRGKLEGMGGERGVRLQELEASTSTKVKEMWSVGESTATDVADWLLGLVMTVGQSD